MRIQRRRKGSALIEFAISFGLLFPLLYGTLEFGLGFFYYNQLANAVRAGARYAAYRTYKSSTSTPDRAFTTAVSNVVVYGDPAGGATPIVPGLTTANVNITVGMVKNVPRTMSVNINNYSMNVFFKTFLLKKPSATFPYIGVFAPPA